MDIDAAQFASISREMLESKSFLQVYEQGKDYLDKPPFLFWISSFSLFIFGINNFAYKLPTVLIISFIGLFSTFRFTLLWYKKRVAIYATLILSTTQAFYLITNDIRTDGILTSFIIFSVWQLFRYIKENKLSGLLLGALGTAFALMSKGPIGLIIVGIAVGGELLMKLQWRKILDFRWLFYILLVAIFLIPMCYGLYTQFDLHPEKIVYGIKSPSGLKFFFWTQSFGRITGESSWSNDTSFFTFFHTILWDFQPWVLLMLAMLVYKMKQVFMSLYQRCFGFKKVEYASLFGFLLPFLALSLSRYKLPHYIFPTFPFMAVMVADFVDSLYKHSWNKWLMRLQFGITHIFFIAPFIAFFIFFSLNNIIFPIVLILLFLLFYVCFSKLQEVSDKIIMSTIIAIFGFGLTTSTYFYPNLLKYQASSMAAKDIMSTTNETLPQVYCYNVFDYSMSFYTQQTISGFDINKIDNYPSGIMIYTNNAGKDTLLKNEKYKVISSYDNFPVTQLTIQFLLEKSRNENVDKRYLLKKI